MLLSKLRVLAVDCQAAKGNLLEVGWASEDRTGSRPVRLPDGVNLSERARRIIGLSEEDLARGATEKEVWHLLDAAARNTDVTAIHFARFEEPYLKWLHHRYGRERRYPFRVLCTHDLVARLVPELPRRSLRAAAGYFGHALGERRRAVEHAEATLTVWRACLGCLETEYGVRTVAELELFLNRTARTRPTTAAGTGRLYPMPPSLLAELPSEPGVYRMLRDETAGSQVLYVGKAASIRQRVRSYFAPGARHAPHTLEMLAQARGLALTPTPTALEAALLEVAEIHRLDPPYNRALRARERAIVFASRDLSDFRASPDRDHPLGPLPSGPLWSAWSEAARGIESPLAAGAKLARGGGEGDPSGLELSLATSESERRDDVLRRGSLLVRRAHWLRLIRRSRLEWPHGELELCGEDGTKADAWSVVEYDRYVVFTTELRRLVASGTETTLHTPRARLSAEKLERLLRYV